MMNSDLNGPDYYAMPYYSVICHFASYKIRCKVEFLRPLQVKSTRMNRYCLELLLVLFAVISVDSAHADKRRGDISAISGHPLEVATAAKPRTSRQAQFQPQFIPQVPHCLPPPAPFEGTNLGFTHFAFLQWEDWIDWMMRINVVLSGKACTHTSECDGSNTVLSCERGACTCPNRPALKWQRGPYDLNTAWDQELKKCVSLKDSACDIYKPKTVHCQKGLVCHEKTKYYGFGLCSTSDAAAAQFAIAMKILLALSISILSYSFI
jgi:hypothetical protein